MLGNRNAPANHSGHNNNTSQFNNNLTMTQLPMVKYTPITPVPHDAPQFENSNTEYFNKQFGCEPSAVYTYTNMYGEIVGHMVRWDLLRNGGPHKEIRPFQFCKSQNGDMDWSSCGFSKPRPLYHLNEICGNPDAPVMVCEGEKTVAAAKILFPDYIVTTSMHGARSVKETDWSPLHGRSVVLALDHDDAGRDYGDDVYRELKGAAQSIQLVCTDVFGQYSIDANETVIEYQSELHKGWDLADAAAKGWTAKHIKELEEVLCQKEVPWLIAYPEPVENVLLNTPIQPKLGLVAANLEDFLTKEILPRKMLMNPIIPEQGLIMLYAPRGIGKTYVALTIACAAASGGRMFDGKWACSTNSKVLFVDGEMPESVIQSRLAQIVSGMNLELRDPSNFQIITPDLQPIDMNMPDLSTPQGQAYVEAHLEGVKLLILDNLSALCRTGKENESESWMPVQGWLLSLRKRGISVLMIHHANKNGAQRGNSKKEDLLDTVIELRRSEKYNPTDGARFEVHYSKARGFFGGEAKPFEVCLTEEDGKIYWKASELADNQLEEALSLQAEGMTQRKIAKEMNISASTVCRLLNTKTAT